MRVRHATAPSATRRRRRAAGWIVATCCLALLIPLVYLRWEPTLRAGERTFWTAAVALPGLIGNSDGGGARVDPPDGTSLHLYWQVGLASGPEAAHADGMRTTIVTRLPEAVASRTTDYFWIGSYLADGSFVQIGYYVAWYAPNSAGWFYCAFTATQVKGPCVYGPFGSVGADASAHTYTLEIASPSGAAADAMWRAMVDGSQVGEFTWTSSDTGQNTPGIYAESSGFVPHAAASQLGPVDFPTGLQTRAVRHTEYLAAAHMRPVYDADDICPPYGADADGRGGALLGSGLPCPGDARWLW